MFTTGSKLFIGGTLLATVAAVVVGITTGGALGLTATLGLISAAVALALLAGINWMIRDGNVSAMEQFALPLFRAGHIPIVGEWLALPLVELAGSSRVGDDAFDEVFHPIAERLVARCDAVLRVGGASAGADEMVDIAESNGRAVFTRLEDVPGC